MKRSLFFLFISPLYLNLALAQRETKSILATTCYKVKADSVPSDWPSEDPKVLKSLEELPGDKIDENSKMMILIEYWFAGKEPMMDKCARFVFVENEKVTNVFADELHYLKSPGNYIPSEDQCGFKDEKISSRTTHFITVSTGWEEPKELTRFFCPSVQKRTERDAKRLRRQLQSSDYNPKEVISPKEYGIWVGEKTEEFLNNGSLFSRWPLNIN